MLVNTLAVVLSVVVFLMIFAHQVASTAMFVPRPASYAESEQILMLETDEGNSVAAYFGDAPNARQTIYYFHGNGEDLGDVMPILATFQLRGYNVFCFDYRGYGLSTGEATEANVYADAQLGLDYLTEKRGIPLESIILLGRSIGSGPAVELAMLHEVGGLILESAFQSIYKLYFPIKWIPGDKFRNKAKLRRVDCPVLVIHGEQDTIVPIAHGHELAAALPEEQVETFWLPEVGHNDVVFRGGSSYWNRIDRFVGR